jgi:hypothetical protein
MGLYIVSNNWLVAGNLIPHALLEVVATVSRLLLADGHTVLAGQDTRCAPDSRRNTIRSGLLYPLQKRTVAVAELGVASDFPTRVVCRQVSGSSVARKRPPAPASAGLVGQPGLRSPCAWAGSGGAF